jgi:diguanylate cyclase (GGDEF)-like protein
MKKSAGERRSDDIAGPDLFTTIGLIVYCSISSLGLFVNPGFSKPLFVLWLAGFISLAVTVSYHSYVSPKPLNKFPFIVLGVIALNLFVQVSGGVHSFLWSVYFLFAVLVAVLFPLRWTYVTTGLILFIETANLIGPRELPAVRWDVYAGFALSLAGVSLATAHVMHRQRRTERQVREEHEQLLAHASAVDPLSDDTKLATLTREGRQAANVNAALEREDVFRGLIDMVYGFVPAHTYALFLRERFGEPLVLRAVRSDSFFIKKPGAALGPEHDRGIIPLCAERGQPQRLSALSVPAVSLGYYLREVPVKSLLALPIVQGGDAMGVLAVDSLEQGAFSLETQDMLAHFVPFFVQIIEKIRFSQELDVRAANFAALHEMSSVLNSSLELGEILSRLAEQLRVMAPHDLCVFACYDEKSKEAVIAHQSGAVLPAAADPPVLTKVVSFLKTLFEAKEGGGESRRFPVEKSAIMSQMLSQWKQGRVSAYHFDDLGSRGEGISLFGDGNGLERLGSLSCWPLTAREKFIGAFFLGSLRPGAFSEYQRHFLDMLMNQVAVVMDNVIMHQQIVNMALTDGLTGLLNHRTFMEKLTEEFNRLDREPQPFSLLLLDIDFFKRINDKYGHPVGDVALKTVSGIIKKSVRTIDFVARYGGEEFAVGLVGADRKGAEQMAERIRKTVENTPVTAGKHTFPCAVSIGAATLNLGREQKKDLIERADQALYHAKRSGRNRVVIHEDLSEADIQAKTAGAAIGKTH